VVNFVSILCGLFAPHSGFLSGPVVLNRRCFGMSDDVMSITRFELRRGCFLSLIKNVVTFGTLGQILLEGLLLNIYCLP